MKKKVVIYFFLIITIINLVSLGIILYQRQKIPVPSFQTEEQNVFDRVKREVKLTPEQIEQFQILRTTFHTKLDSLSTQVEQDNKRLATEIKKDNPDTVIINRLIRDISAMQTKSKYLVIHHFYSIKKILTKEQQEKFFDIVLQRFTGKNKLTGPACTGQIDTHTK